MVEHPAVIKGRNKKMGDKRRYSDRRDYLIQAVHRRRKKLREKAIAYKGGRCELCGYNKCIEALEFHHGNNENKDFGILRKVTREVGRE